jgi:dihydrofolate reductase
MRKVVASAWITLDGVFDAGSMSEWFLPYHTDERGKIITEWIMACDTYLLGRTTYQMLAPHWSALKNNEMGIADKLNNVQKIVVSSTLEKAEWNNSIIINKNVPEEITKLKEQSGGDLLIAGSATLVQSLMEADLIDEYRFLVQPVIMGSGKRYFKEGMHTAGLKLVRNEAVGAGVVFLCYQSKNTNARI